MAVSKRIDAIASNGRLESIAARIKDIDNERVKDVVLSLHSKDLNVFLSLFSSSNDIFVEETDDLQIISESHNTHYANKDNKKFTVAQALLLTIKAQVFLLYKLLGKTSDNIPTRLGYQPLDKKSIDYKMDHSMLVNQPCDVHIFRNMTESQNRLVKEISSFIYYIEINLSLCEKVIEEDTRIGNSVEESKFWLDCQLKEIDALLEGDTGKGHPIDEEYYWDLLKVDEDPSLAKKWWHKLLPAQLREIARGMRDKRLSTYTHLERKIFKDNLELIKKFRVVVRHLDEFSGTNVNISGVVLYYSYSYLKCTIPHSSFLKCVSDSYKNFGFTKKITSSARFSQAYSKTVLKENIAYLDFCKKMDEYCSLGM